MTQPPITLSAPIGPSDRPLVILGHSLGTGTLIWEDVVPALAAEYRVSLLTLPGHEGTQLAPEPFSLAELAGAVAAAGQELAGGRFLYAGVSIGGALALELALHHPEALYGVASLASGASLGGFDFWTARSALVREQSPASLVGPSSKTWFAPEAFEQQPVMVGRILRVLQETPIEGYARCSDALAGYDVRDQLSQISVPVLAVYGEHDTVGPEEKQDEIVAGVQRGRKARIDGAAHQPPAEKPERTAETLLEFFAEVTR